MEKVKKRNLLITLALLVVMVVCVLVCSGFTTPSAMADTSTSDSAKELIETKITLYDGSVDSTGLTTVTKNEVEMTVKGFSTTTNTLTNVTVGDKSYLKSTPTGGKSSSSRYIKVIVPAKYDNFVLNVVASPNSTTPVNIGLGISSEYTTTDTKVLTTGSDNTVYALGTSETVPDGVYYLTFDGSARIAEISISAFAEEEKEVIGTVVKPTNTVKYLKIALGGVCVTTLVLVLILCIKSTVSKQKTL